MTASKVIGRSWVSPTSALLLSTSPQSRSPRLPQARVLGNGQPTSPQAGGLAEIAITPGIRRPGVAGPGPRPADRRPGLGRVLRQSSSEAAMEDVPTDWYALAQRELRGLEGELRLLQEADELQVLALKRGSRRWLPPAA